MDIYHLFRWHFGSRPFGFSHPAKMCAEFVGCLGALDRCLLRRQICCSCCVEFNNRWMQGFSSAGFVVHAYSSLDLDGSHHFLGTDYAPQKQNVTQSSKLVVEGSVRVVFG